MQSRFDGAFRHIDNGGYVGNRKVLCKSQVKEQLLGFGQLAEGLLQGIGKGLPVKPEGGVVEGLLCGALHEVVLYLLPKVKAFVVVAKHVVRDSKQPRSQTLCGLVVGCLAPDGEENILCEVRGQRLVAPVRRKKKPFTVAA